MFQFAEFNKDFHKCVFVVDTVTTAFICSIIADGCPIDLILERKQGIDNDDDAYQALKIFIGCCINVESLTEISVDPPYFVTAYDLKKIKGLKRQIKPYLKQYDKSYTYIGPSTSTFMNALHGNGENIIYMYHGSGDYWKREDGSLVSGSIFKLIMKRLIIGLILDMPNSRWNCFWPKRAYSLCKLDDQDVIWLDYKNFKSKIIERELNAIFQFDGSKRNVFYCPYAGLLSPKGIGEDTTVYDDLNIRLIERHIDKSSERLFIKYHPRMYRTNHAIKSDLVNKLRDIGYEAYDIGVMVPKSIGGASVPLEVIFRYCDLTKLVAMDNSSIWNLSEDHDICKIMDYRDAIEGEYERLSEQTPHIIKKIDCQSIKIYG